MVGVLPATAPIAGVPTAVMAAQTTAGAAPPGTFIPVFHVGGTYDGKPVDLNFSLNSAI